jgi:hypothetical protein
VLAQLTGITVHVLTCHSTQTHYPICVPANLRSDTIATVKDIYLFMGRELELMEGIPAGNVLG